MTCLKLVAGKAGLGPLLSLALLSACTPSNRPQPPQLQVACSGPGCGAEPGRYTGSGLGVWNYENTSAGTQPLKIELDGLTANDVTLVLTNPTAQSQTLQGEWVGRGTVKPAPPRPFVPNTTDPVPSGDVPAPPTAEQRSWTVPQNVTTSQISYRPYAATLRAQITSGGFTHKFWVADEAWNARLQGVFPALAAGFFGSAQYPGLLPQYLGDFKVQPWGEYPQNEANSALISPQTRDINYVMAPTGGVDFFNFGELRLPASAPNSNGALMVFINSARFACQGVPEGQCIDGKVPDLYMPVLGLYLHELTHLVQAYQRNVLRGKDQVFELWLREAMASAYGYTVAASRFPAGFFNLAELGGWFAGGYACSLTDNSGGIGVPVTDKTCLQNYYKGGQAFLVFLAQQYGTEIFTRLTEARGTGIGALDEAIRAAGGTGFKDAFRRWGAALALPDAAATPAGYGYPARTFGAAGEWTVPALDARDFASARRLPALFPGVIKAYSHLPLVDAAQSGTYTREVQVPPGVMLSVYIR
jgi:Peptidase M30